MSAVEYGNRITPALESAKNGELEMILYMSVSLSIIRRNPDSLFVFEGFCVSELTLWSRCIDQQEAKLFNMTGCVY